MTVHEGNGGWFSVQASRLLTSRIWTTTAWHRHVSQERSTVPRWVPVGFPEPRRAVLQWDHVLGVVVMIAVEIDWILTLLLLLGFSLHQNVSQI